jgi:hypothetical protein
MLSPGETPGTTVDLQEGDRDERVQGGKGPGGIPEIGVGRRYGTCGTWASAPALRPPTVQSLFIRCRVEGQSGEVRQRSDSQRFGVGNEIFELQILQLLGTYIQERLLLARVQ